MKRWFLSALILVPLVSAADDRSATEYLLNEPASLMDIGIIRAKLDIETMDDLFAKKFMETSGATNVYVISSVSYNISDDEITVLFSVLAAQNRNFGAGCQNLLESAGIIFQERFYRRFMPSGPISDETREMSWKIEDHVVFVCEAQDQATGTLRATARMNLSERKVTIETH